MKPIDYIILAAIIVGCVLLCFIIIGGVQLCSWLKNKRYQRIISNNEELSNRIDDYFKVDNKRLDISNQLYEAQKTMKELRESIPFSLPEEKAEIYKSIIALKTQIELLKKSDELSWENRRLCIENVYLCAKLTLTSRQAKFFLKYGGWYTNE